jgi:hypothetical protein
MYVVDSDKIFLGDQLLQFGAEFQRLIDDGGIGLQNVGLLLRVDAADHLRKLYHF